VDDWKLVTRPAQSGEEAGSQPPIGTAELYDLRTDPLEQRDVAPNNGDTVDRLEQILDSHVGRDAAAETIAKTAEQLDAATRKQLEALGYID